MTVCGCWWCTWVREVSTEVVDTEGVGVIVYALDVCEGVCGWYTCVREVSPEVVDTEGVGLIVTAQGVGVGVTGVPVLEKYPLR